MINYFIATADNYRGYPFTGNGL